MGALLNWMIVLHELHKQSSENDLRIHFFRFSKLLEKHLNLTHAVLLIRNENGFKSFLSQEKFEFSEKNPTFHALVQKKKAVTAWSMSGRKALSIYWPILIDEECVACYLLVLKSKESRLTNEKKLLMELLTDRVVDLLNRKRLFEKLQAANRQDIFNWMSAAIVHEIRNPLTALDTLVQLLPEKRGDYFFMDSFQALMQREISRLSDLTDDLLDLSGVGLEKMVKVDLKEVIQQITQLLGPLFYSKKIQLKVKTPKQLFLKGNETQIKSLLINLLQNGLKAIRSEGVIEISTRFLAKSAYGRNWLEIQVKDNGRGISEENLGKIFKPFFSADRLGTGLGLAICRKITEDHKGYIRVKSRLGKGTAFYVYLPATPIP